jgi:hypothetical protein
VSTRPDPVGVSVAVDPGYDDPAVFSHITVVTFPGGNDGAADPMRPVSQAAATRTALLPTTGVYTLAYCNAVNISAASAPAALMFSDWVFVNVTVLPNPVLVPTIAVTTVPTATSGGSGGDPVATCATSATVTATCAVAGTVPRYTVDTPSTPTAGSPILAAGGLSYTTKRNVTLRVACFVSADATQPPSPTVVRTVCIDPPVIVTPPPATPVPTAVVLPVATPTVTKVVTGGLTTSESAAAATNRVDVTVTIGFDAAIDSAAFGM